MWTARAFRDGGWQDLTVLDVHGVFSSAATLAAAEKFIGPNYPRPLDHLRQEATTPGLARLAIETFAFEAMSEAKEFSWDSPVGIVGMERGLGLYPREPVAGSVRPTLVWHDRTTVIVPTQRDDDIELTYTSSPDDEVLAERLRHQHGGAEGIEALLDWRGYFGLESAVIDGLKQMRPQGRGLIASVRATTGFIVGTVLRRIPGPQPIFRKDPTWRGRLDRMRASYPHIPARCPDLPWINPVAHECATIIVHGTVSCGIHCAKELYPSLAPVPTPTYRFEHDTFESVIDNAKELARSIREKVRVNRLLLVAHSRGGLVARYARAELLRTGYSAEVHLITLGTPHNGTPLVQITGNVLSLLFKLGEDAIGAIPKATPLSLAYGYLIGSRELPPGVAIMAEGSEILSTLNLMDTPDHIRAWGSDFDIHHSPPAFGIEADWALFSAMGARKHDLVVPMSSALGYGAAQQVLKCSHSQYFRDAGVGAAIRSFCAPARAKQDQHVAVAGTPAPDPAAIAEETLKKLGVKKPPNSDLKK